MSDNSNTLTALNGAWTSLKQKWSESSAPEYLNTVSSSIPQETKDFVSGARQRYLNPKHIRSPKVYVGLGEERPFYLEKSPSLLGSRVKHNFQYFYLNYIIIAAILFVMTLMISPTAIIGVVLVVGAWMFTLKATQSGSVTVRGITIPQQPILAALAIATFFAMSYILSSIFWWTLFSSAFCAGGHAILRDATMHRDEEDKVDMTGDLGEDSAFLNTRPSDGSLGGGGDVV
mmetsp:Transcript_14975/g.22109  ORF Transcript_14975/g.22109 Transcript_14975/m.22109 type:complete len:231 (-) Transcript_14975:109-801(-)|eukprot:CAMPEP_0116029364 /NCGR_PEP_ID=MMETSP0321-20121206/16099_1 /TAXON_ID=163516 /ORGANISM="Leptocylindrus danicus var. danicus, Strain B650" /LENGTH=230 /DNA_ID=CAMNT_0003503733 /DNA_START=84 /DNA_END=776 /DNA_ORIENTATION=+